MPCPPETPASSAAAQPSRTYLGCAVAILFLVNFVNYMDRMVLSAVIAPIQEEFGLSRTQLGMLTGLAFAVFYGTAGLGIAWLADRFNRKLIITCSMLAWSLMTALTGAAQNFWHLFLVRIGVGVGESGAIPTSHSIIGDLFKPEQRSAALAIFTGGATLGLTAGLALSGFVAELYGWRWSFIAAAAVSLPVILLVALVLREPTRGQAEGIRTGQAPNFFLVVRRLFSIRTFRHLLIVNSLGALALFGIIQWMPYFLIHKFGLGVAEAGFYFGTVLGVSAAIGGVVGGFAANWLVKRNFMWLIWLPLGSALLAFPLYEAAVFAPSADLAMLFVMLVNITGGLSFGPLITAVQSVVTPNMRASASAFVGFTSSVIGVGGGPFLVGLLSDWFSDPPALARAVLDGLGIPRMESVPALQWALAVAVAFTLWALLHYAVLVKIFSRDRIPPAAPPASPSPSRFRKTPA